MIFERSRRTTFLIWLLTLAGLLLATGAGVYLVLRRVSLAGGLALLVAAACVGLAAKLALRLREWPPGKLGLFRDRLVLMQRRSEQHVPWDRIESATLGSAGGWAAGKHSFISITDRLTLRMRGWRGPNTIAFRPADFGLDPVSCRDLVCQLRDEPGRRQRLPEFDSALDLSLRPIVSGELISPRI